MNLTVIWDNPTRNLINRAEFGKVMSFKNKLGCKPASLERYLEISLPDKVNMSWKRKLEYAINKQFQKDRKATIYFTGFKGTNSDEFKGAARSGFVVSARNAQEFSNRVANGILELRGNAKGLSTFDHVSGINPVRKIVL